MKITIKLGKPVWTGTQNSFPWTLSRGRKVIDYGSASDEKEAFRAAVEAKKYYERQW